MATKERNTEAPHLALVVVNASERFAARSNEPRYLSDLHRGAAGEILEDAIRVLSLLEAYAYLEKEMPLIDPHAVSTMASLLVEKLRSAQRHLAEARP